MEFSGKVNVIHCKFQKELPILMQTTLNQDVICRVSGVGNASVYALKNLDATLEGVGKIGYRGDPVIVKKVNGIGAVYKK
jgi:hypothetical protein